MARTNRIVIGFCREVSMIHAISTLIKSGFEVIAFDSINYSPGLHIRGLKDRFIDGDIEKDENRYIDFLKKIGEKYPDSILLTGDDYTSHVICKYQDKLKTYFNFLTQDYETFKTITNKYLLSNLARENNLKVPFTSELNGIDIKGLLYPLMIKPKVGAGGRKQIKCLSAPQIESFIKSGNNLSDYFVQEYVDGSVSNLYTVNLLMDRGSKPVCAFSANRLNVFRSKQISEGVTTFIKSVNLDNLINDSINFLEKIKWVGIAELEFKKDNKDGEFKLLEINPRLWSWARLASISDVNFPRYYVSTLLNENPPSSSPSYKGGELGGKTFCFKEDVYYLRIMSDLYSNIFRLLNRECSLMEFLRQIFQRLKLIISGKLFIERSENFRWLYCYLQQRKEYV
ncbi:MAG: hypothetical protein A3I04_05650 [Nitrospinae bacterium RIFCSPLOWO2_02_FULL_39_110]|nr:MAG: hypothetical protein A2W53_06400 [Nitrospinae bacterium RIFCSPHIGHO2_02_39_11]OGV99838.1 MAG: hypothetical protein A3D97_04000 [Nitrospinae bacterium RIFCSPHIGHO2_12_FULL_39_42]OGV99870.1 MAG: hypothetical protein A3D20_05425 [Nitrospinae bacterium RIFCSPHIGHO2_02_FULL_39_82]OGW02902.1 MAG: hypothetical protein A2Z59_03440 [Nitrospinae bacterium RIFCSPLOWO2_02_39_17]OGW05865.1 MAG: hypothetical protein A3I04_05650 [Nitrospinae bacterium RIFCSPLOWO2_02_FULL_39_110]OGW11377.1 MAG: hypoth